MFESIGQMLSTINIFGLGVFPIIESFIIGLGILFSNGRQLNFNIWVFICNFIFASVLLVNLNKNTGQYIAIAIVTIIILMLPDNSLQAIFARHKDEEK